MKRRSWQPQAAGLIAVGLAVWLAAISNEQDTQRWVLISAIAALGAGQMRSRQNDITSEETGASRKRDITRSNMLPAILCLLLLGGCVGPVTSEPVPSADAAETSSGWTDADQSRAVRVVIEGGAYVGGDIWVEVVASSGNERAGQGADQAASVGDTTQTPEARGNLSAAVTGQGNADATTATDEAEVGASDTDDAEPRE